MTKSNTSEKLTAEEKKANKLTFLKAYGYYMSVSSSPIKQATIILDTTRGNFTLSNKKKTYVFNKYRKLWGLKEVSYLDTFIVEALQGEEEKARERLMDAVKLVEDRKFFEKDG